MVFVMKYQLSLANGSQLFCEQGHVLASNHLFTDKTISHRLKEELALVNMWALDHCVASFAKPNLL